jgi:hypothetical protein
MNEFIPRTPVNLSEDWMILVFLFALVALAYTRRLYPARLERLWRSTWNIRALHQAIREEPNTPRASLFFNISFYLTFSLVLFLVIKFFGNEPLGYSGLGLYAIILGTIMGIYLLKTIGIHVVQILADGDFGLMEYKYNVFLINRMIGLMLIPFALFLAYAPTTEVQPALWAALSVSGVMIIYRIMRGLINALSMGVPPFYIFFYICTLEILPLAVCFKAFSL